MKNTGYTLIIILILFLSGCSESQQFDTSSGNDLVSKNEASQRTKNKYLAYIHSITILTKKEVINSQFNKIIEKCTSDIANQCVILYSSQNSGEYTDSKIKIRLKPEGVSHYINLASNDGEVTSQSSSAEDLTDKIIDNEKRLTMLESYKKKLIKLEDNPKNNIDSLIKISSELSKVQTDLEYTQGKKSELYQRTKMDILNINLSVSGNESFWEPIGYAFSDFSDNFSDGLAVFITSSAYFIPWVFVLFIIIYVIRIILRRKHAKL